MNHLAHALLAGNVDDLLLGGMLGDFWRGGVDPSWRAGVGAGVILHRRIDVFTDNHPIVSAARARFAPPYRRYAGILLDVHFDHLLARDWSNHTATPIDALSARMNRMLEANAGWLPDAMNRFAGFFRAHGLFASYASREVIDRVLRGIGARLKRANPLDSAAAVLWADEAALTLAFAQFFPELREFARSQVKLLTQADRAI